MKSSIQTLNYRVKILDIREMQLEDMSTVAVIRSEEDLEETNANYLPIRSIRTQDDIPINECTNHKRVPNENIIKRRSDVRNMIATIDEEFSCDEPEENNNRKMATVNTNGAIVVHAHNSPSVYSVVAAKQSSSSINGNTKQDPEEEHSDDEEQKEMKPKAQQQQRKNSKSNLLKDFNGGYDSVKRIFQKTMSMDRMTATKMQKPPRKFLTLNNNRKSSAASGESDFEDSVSLKVRRSGSAGDLEDSYSLPDKIPTTPPPKKTTTKRASSFINLMRSNLKF